MMRFVHLYAVRIVPAVVLLALVFEIVSLYAIDWREKRIQREIESLGARVSLEFRGSRSIPLSIMDRMPLAWRIREVDLSGRDVPLALGLPNSPQ